MKHLALIAGLLGTVLPLGGCLAPMWLAAYEADKNSPPVNVPTRNDPVRDGRLYRNQYGVTLQFADGHLRIEGPDCLSLRARLVGTTTTQFNGPPYPFYQFVIVERTVHAPRCEAPIRNMDSFTMSPHGWQQGGGPSPTGWSLELASSSMGAFDPPLYLWFTSKTATIEDPR